MSSVGNIEILNSKVTNILNNHLNKNEKVEFCIVGSYNQSLIALESRLLIIKYGISANMPMSSNVISLQYTDITGINTVGATFTRAYIEITTPSYQTGKKIKAPNNAPNCIPIGMEGFNKYMPYLEKLNKMIQDAKENQYKLPQQTNDDVVSKLERLTKLYESGGLSEDEFKLAKKEIIEQK